METRVRLAVGVLLFGLLLAPLGANVAGNANISGYAGPSVIFYSAFPRDVTVAPIYDINGNQVPSVAFRQDSGPGGLILGSHDCFGGAAGPVYAQSPGTYNAVAYFSSPRRFCVFSYSNSGASDFYGNLDWD